MSLNQHTDDFKLSAVEHYLENRDEITIQDTCDIFKCSERSLRRWIDRYLNEGSVERKDRTPGAYKVTVKQIDFIRKELNKYPDITIKQLYVKLVAQFPENILNRQYIHEIIRDNNITRKRATSTHFPLTFRGQPRDKRKELQAFFDVIKKYNLRDIISIDETAVRPGMSFNYCRSPLGNRCYIKTNSNEIFKKYSLIVAINNKKCLAWHLYDQGAVNAERFEEFIEAIASKYRNKLFVLDNAQIHKRPRVKEILKDTGNSVVYTLPYSPRLNPIEQFFNQLKHYMKLEKAMTLPKLKESVKNSLEHIKPIHYSNYFAYAYDKEHYKNSGPRTLSNKHRPAKIYLA